MSTEQRRLVTSLDPVSIAKEAVVFLYCQGMLLAHVQLLSENIPMAFFALTISVL